MRLIDADKLKANLDFAIKDGPLYIQATVAQYIEEAPTVDQESLRPISRKQVEKMRGEWRSIHGLSEYYCSRCGEEFEIYSYDKDKYKFCPYCMSPMTEDAVDILWKRLEALNDGKRD